MSVTHRMESQRGRIGREINSGLDKNNKPWANFSLAVDVNRRNDQGSWEKVGTDWYQVSVFGAQAKNVAESLRPGTPVVVSGDVEQRVRVVEGPDGAPAAQTRDEVRATMVAPDLILTPVVIPEGPASAGPSQAGPGATASVATGPSQTPAPAVTPSASPSAGSPSAHASAPETGQAATLGGDASIWPPAVQSGSGSAGLR